MKISKVVRSRLSGQILACYTMNEPRGLNLRWCRFQGQGKTDVAGDARSAA